MSSSYTFTFTGDSSELSSTFFPEIVLDDDAEYSCALLELTTYHTIPNVTHSNNRVEFYWTNLHKSATGPKDGELTHFDLPTGTYEAAEILDYIKYYLGLYGISFYFEVSTTTFKATITCSTALFTGGINSNNILNHIFGFNAGRTLSTNIKNTSDEVIKISSQNVIRVECNLTSGAYVNGKRSQSIYEFATNKVEAGYKIIERPNNLIYLPITSKRINFIQLSIFDQNGNLIDFQGEPITCRIHIKKNN